MSKRISIIGYKKVGRSSLCNIIIGEAISPVNQQICTTLPITYKSNTNSIDNISEYDKLYYLTNNNFYGRNLYNKETKDVKILNTRIKNLMQRNDVKNIIIEKKIYENTIIDTPEFENDMIKEIINVTNICIYVIHYIRDINKNEAREKEIFKQINDFYNSNVIYVITHFDQINKMYEDNYEKDYDVISTDIIKNLNKKFKNYYKPKTDSVDKSKTDSIDKSKTDSMDKFKMDSMDKFKMNSMNKFKMNNYDESNDIFTKDNTFCITNDKNYCNYEELKNKLVEKINNIKPDSLKIFQIKLDECLKTLNNIYKHVTKNNKIYIPEEFKYYSKKKDSKITLDELTNFLKQHYINFFDDCVKCSFVYEIDDKKITILANIDKILLFDNIEIFIDENSFCKLDIDNNNKTIVINGLDNEFRFEGIYYKNYDDNIYFGEFLYLHKKRKNKIYWKTILL